MINSRMQIYIGTVCLDKNRWGSREPSLKVSEWAGCFAADGFDGIELWEFHYLLAGEAERKQLRSTGLPLVYNSYVGFADDENEARMKSVMAIREIGPLAVKYNLGKVPEKLDEYRRNLLSWAEELPTSCKLLCECHAGTVLEKVDAALAFHEELDAERFGVIVHPMGDIEILRQWLDAFGDRVRELHLQFRTPEMDPATGPGRECLETCAALLKKHCFSGVATIEFTRGIGRDEDIEKIYSNACSDLRNCREIFRKAHI